MTLFFNLHRLGWKRTPLLRLHILKPRDSTLRLIAALLLALTIFSLESGHIALRSAMADELVQARMKATEYELDVICLLRPECSLRSWGEDGRYHSVTVRRDYINHLEEKR